MSIIYAPMNIPRSVAQQTTVLISILQRKRIVRRLVFAWLELPSLILTFVR